MGSGRANWDFGLTSIDWMPLFLQKPRFSKFVRGRVYRSVFAITRAFHAQVDRISLVGQNFASMALVVQNSICVALVGQNFSSVTLVGQNFT